MFAVYGLPVGRLAFGVWRSPLARGIHKRHSFIKAAHPETWYLLQISRTFDSKGPIFSRSRAHSVIFELAWRPRFPFAPHLPLSQISSPRCLISSPKSSPPQHALFWVAHASLTMRAPLFWLASLTMHAPAYTCVGCVCAECVCRDPRMGLVDGRVCCAQLCYVFYVRYG